MTNKKLWLGMLVIILLGFVNCASLLPGGSLAKPDISKAVTIDGLSVDPDNCAYLLGPIVSINNQDIKRTAVGGLLVSDGLPTGRLARVPIGQELSAKIRYQTSIHYNRNANTPSESYEAIGTITIPPLESGKVYRIYNTSCNPDLKESKLLKYFGVNISVYNTSTERYDTIHSQQVSVNPPQRPKR